jgi:ankyrin repeat protein
MEVYMSEYLIDATIKEYKNRLINSTHPKGTTELFLASADADTEVVQELLKRGSKVNAKNADGFTPLHKLCENKGIPRCAVFLLKAKATPNIQDNIGKMTPLHFAVTKDNYPLIDVLLEYGADPTIQNASGKTPIDILKDKILEHDTDNNRKYLEIFMNWKKPEEVGLKKIFKYFQKK